VPVKSVMALRIPPDVATATFVTIANVRLYVAMEEWKLAKPVIPKLTRLDALMASIVTRNAVANRGVATARSILPKAKLVTSSGFPMDVHQAIPVPRNVCVQ